MSPKDDKSDDAELLALESLLVAEEEADNSSKVQVKDVVPRLREDSTFAEAFSYQVDLPQEQLSELRKTITEKGEELDSSDDEEVKNFLMRKYNEYGCDINKKLKQQRQTQHENKVEREVNSLINANQVIKNAEGTTAAHHIKNPHNPVKRQSLVNNNSNGNETPRPNAKLVQSKLPVVPIFMDPTFGFRIINPLVSSALLTERMQGRKAVSFANLALHTQRGDLSKDWVIAGTIVSKQPVRTTKKGEPFSIWRLSDLRGDIKTLSLFLFGTAHKDLWKTAQGMCIAILNPNVLEKRSEGGDIASLSIDTAQKVLVIGQSKDYGICKARKANGDACTSVVNLNECDYCIYHMKQEYGKMSRRSELQSASLGRGLNELRNKVLGKFFSLIIFFNLFQY